MERVLVEPLIVNWSLSQQTQEMFTLTELYDGAKVLSVIGQEVQPSEYPKKQIIKNNKIILKINELKTKKEEQEGIKTVCDKKHVNKHQVKEDQTHMPLPHIIYIL